MKRLYILFFLIKLSFAYSQVPGVTNFTINNGIPSNTVYDIIQDENGFIWIATDYGLSKFDGKTFKNYTTRDGLSGNEILFFKKDSSNRIWLAFFNGKLGFIKNDSLFNSNNSIFLKSLENSSYVSDIYEDSNNNVWFYYTDKKLKKLNKNQTIESFDIPNSEELEYSKLIIEDKNNSIYLFSYFKKNNELILVTKKIDDNKNLPWLLYDKENFTDNSNNKIESSLGLIFRDKTDLFQTISKNIGNVSNSFLAKTYQVKDSYWITNVNDGAYIFNKHDKSFLKILKNTKTTRLFVDFENNIWIGSQSNGLYFFPSLNTYGFQFNEIEKNNLQSVNIFNNKLFIGNSSSELTILNPKTYEVNNTIKVSENPSKIKQLIVYNNLLYIVEEIGLYKINDELIIQKEKYLQNETYNKKLVNFKNISFDDKYIYSSNSNGVGKLNIKNNQLTKIWDKRSTSIYASESDTTWVGTTSGLYYYTNDTIQKYNLTTEFDNSIIYDLKENACGLLIGTNSYGLGILNNGKLDIISKKDGLLSDYIKSIFVESKNKIWLSTNFGLNYIELDASNKLKDIKSFTISDGLYSNDVRGCVVKNNKVYVATSNGLNIIDLSKDKNLHKPKIKINSIEVNNNPINISSETIFTHTLNTFQFEYSGISFKSLGNIGFKYMLEGLEKDWVETENTNVRFSSLPPNKYTFKIKSINKDGTESDEVEEFSFIIKPPFYKTWWFITSFIIFSILLLLFILYRREQKIKIKRQTKEKISSLRYQALNAQMNPHFLNNLLNTIEALSSKNKFQLVKEILTKFTSLINLVLNATKSNVISLKEEMEMVELYLALQQIRFEKSINKNITYSLGDLDIEDILVPPMIIQPIIENSFKHGFTNTQKLYSLTIDFKIEENSYVICEIIDNGTSTEKAANTASSGISFKNINERLQLFDENRKKENLIFYSEIKNEFDKLEGFKVKIKIPLVNL